jgi:CheY-like chemotaxis protein
MAQLSIQDRQQRVSVFLKQVDEEVRKADYDKALELVRKVYEFDIKNVYARAYEERILSMRMEKERKDTMAELHRKAEEQAEVEVKRRLKEFFHQHEIEEKLKRDQERREQELEAQARRKSVVEVSAEATRDMQSVELDAVNRIADVERKLTSQIQSLSTPASASQDIPKLRALYEARIADVQRQFETAQKERQRIETEMIARIDQERRKLNEDLVQQVENARAETQQQAAGKERARDIEQYQTIMQLMTRMQLSPQIRQPILQAMQISMNISEEQHHEIERSVHVATYANAVRELWANGKPSDEELQQFANVQALYGISTGEHNTILKRVKHELGIADEATLAIVIEDDPSIRKFAEHLLRKFIPQVQAVENAEQAVALLRQQRPSVILSDINLGPGKMTGFNFLQRLVAGEFGDDAKTIPVVMMSSIVDEFFIKTAEQLGARSYIPKPITKDALAQALEHAMKQ